MENAESSMPLFKDSESEMTLVAHSSNAQKCLHGARRFTSARILVLDGIKSIRVLTPGAGQSLEASRHNDGVYIEKQG